MVRDDDPLVTQRDIGPAVAAALSAVGFGDAEEIGRGGFGVVFRCTQPDVDRIVAVKVLTADLDEVNRARFLREQRAMGRLSGHPNIVNVLEVGDTEEGRPYIVMQYHAQDSLEARIRRHGPLPLDQALRLGVKMAGAVSTAHRLGILHRDIKPANILFTDYGEPALTDFGIAHISGGFETGTGTVTGSPAFTAPEVLRGDPPSTASDVYGLGAVLFSALTGHAAFERRTGEQVVAQFLRITTEPVPDLHGHGIDQDVSAEIARAMAANPQDRPSAVELGDELRRIEGLNGFPVDEMALHGGGSNALPGAPNPIRTVVDSDERAAVVRFSSVADGVRGAGNLPVELTSFVGRRSEITETREMLSRSPLVTLTGIGGVGKTRLALRVAATVQRDFVDGVWLVELGELTDASLLANVVAGALGLRNYSARPLREALVEFVAERSLLVVLDNCEQVVDAVADLADTLLRACPGLRILATSRELLGIGGEESLRVPPLTVPDPDRQSSLSGLPSYDAVMLFAERAATAVPGFELTEDNKTAVAQICQRLDGLPLPIELAAARLRAMSPEQILARLTDRYALLTQGSRRAPSRQQTLRLSIDWSYELCTPVEQRVWARVAVFSGIFELDAAEVVCGRGLDAAELLDTMASLVDKSILIREESGTAVRFRLLDTVRDYGREKLHDKAVLQELCRRHRDWYQKFVLTGEADWISSRQLEWVNRLEREQPNLREALEFCVSDSPDAGLRIAAALFPFWSASGLLSEGRRWLARFLAGTTGGPSVDRAKALYAASVLAEVQGDLQAGAALVDEGLALAEQSTDAMIEALAAYSDGILAIFGGELGRACSRLEDALDTFRARQNLPLQTGATNMLGLANTLRGETERALECYRQVLALSQARGEVVYRSYALWVMGVTEWRQGDADRAGGLLERSLRLTREASNRRTAASGLEALAWIAAGEKKPRRAAVLLGSAEELSRSVGSDAVVFPGLLVHHEECERTSRRALGERGFAEASREGRRLGFDAAVAYALGERAPGAPPAPTAMLPKLTKREGQVADLVAEGLTNKEIAARLVISPRTAQGHVEHVLAKLGFTSRAQIAAWVVEQNRTSH
ncbi:protein kinase domain-containing protein [Rhodococcus opacus]|uniref:Protein kinase n=1 Tax=Rhodococcus opacus TaxID=37919 RepID=A0AAX3YF05_RHOOP|nr:MULTISPECIES: protein kinase [Rhodococcus]MCZ4589073.1 protein kinase [Rhodococcus opacus]MDI9941457.1 protein kinase [Rhodococcus sp. IEGM 1351]MDV6242059.1 protein kinase [Rhodococcus opacus]WLF46860.1 protein kinase [Rhodococcus opacus]